MQFSPFHVAFVYASDTIYVFNVAFIKVERQSFGLNSAQGMINKV